MALNIETVKKYPLETVCSNCGKMWADHYGERCPNPDNTALTGTIFEPVKETA
jgi:hypothetical protein